MDTSGLFANHFWILAGLIGLAVALTFAVFHWSKFEEGYEKGDAADPDRLARDNPPDEGCMTPRAAKYPSANTFLRGRSFSRDRPRRISPGRFCRSSSETSGVSVHHG